MDMQGFGVCPKLPLGLCPRLLDEDHMPQGDEDDARLYGVDAAGSNPAAAWLLLLAGLIGLGALLPSGGSPGIRRSRACGCAALLGLLVGLYLALQLFPAQLILQVIPPKPHPLLLKHRMDVQSATTLYCPKSERNRLGKVCTSVSFVTRVLIACPCGCKWVCPNLPHIAWVHNREHVSQGK